MRQIDKASRENEDAVPCSKTGLGEQQIKGWQCPRGERSDNGFMAVQRMGGQVRVTDTLKGVRTGESMKKVNSGQCYHVWQINGPSRLGIWSWANETVQSEMSPEGRRAELTHRSGSQARGLCGQPWTFHRCHSQAWSWCLSNSSSRLAPQTEARTKEIRVLIRGFGS